MKKPNRPNVMRIAGIVLLMAVGCAGVIVIVHAGGLATRNVGEISAKLEIADESNVKQCVVTGTQTYLQSTKEGMAQLLIKKDGVRVASASARIRADTEVQAAAGLSALVLYLTGRPGLPAMQCSDIPGDGRGFECSEIKFEGDRRFFAEHADKIIDWWDSHASLTHTNYVSPSPNLANLGKLQLSAHGNHGLDHPFFSYAVLFFDPSDATKIVGGTVRLGPAVLDADGFNVLSGTLLEDTITPAPGDFVVEFQAEGITQHTFGAYLAYVALHVQADGTVDVRGIARNWHSLDGPFVLEGVGNTKFVMPSQ